MSKYIYIFVLLFFSSCANHNDRKITSNPFIDTVSDKKEKDVRGLETRLGSTNYIIYLPDNFSISEARGKEGQLGYNIYPKDSSSTLFGFIEVIHGSPISDFVPDDASPVEILERDFQGRKTYWKIHQPKSGYYEATIDSLGELSATISSKNRYEIDTLISVILSLREN